MKTNLKSLLLAGPTQAHTYEESAIVVAQTTPDIAAARKKPSHSTDEVSAPRSRSALPLHIRPDEIDLAGFSAEQRIIIVRMLRKHSAFVLDKVDILKCMSADALELVLELLAIHPKAIAEDIEKLSKKDVDFLRRLRPENLCESLHGGDAYCDSIFGENSRYIYQLHHDYAIDQGDLVSKYNFLRENKNDAKVKRIFFIA